MKRFLFAVLIGLYFVTVAAIGLAVFVSLVYSVIWLANYSLKALLTVLFAVPVFVLGFNAGWES